MSIKIKQSSTSRALVFLMVDDADHITGKTGLTPTVTIRKEGGSFASPAGSVTEIANGWYQVAGNADDTDTLGSLLLHASATGADPVDDRYEVVAYDPLATSMGLNLAKGTNLTGLNDIAATAIVSGGAITTSSGKVSTVVTVEQLTNNNDKTGYSLASAPPSASDIATEVWSAGTRTLTAFSFLTSGGIADAVWDEDITTHTTTDSAGEALQAAGSAGDPWATPLPGSYTSGQAGYIVGNSLDASVGSRASAEAISSLESHGDAAWATATGFLTSGDMPNNFSILAINASGHISRVTLVDTTTTNTDMRGTDGAVTSLTGIATFAQVEDVKDYFDEMTEDDGSGNTRWTAKSLEEAPTGGGGGGNPWSLLQEDNKDAGTMGESLFLAAQAAGGAGSVIVTITVESGGNPIDGVSCFISTDTAGGNRITNARFTDGMGQVTFLLDPGQYYLWRQHNQFEFPNPTSLVVEADGSFLLGG